MQTAQAVIGSGWGDEGKGLLVDFYAAGSKMPMVVRYSGGANAGHTVQLSDGRRHVFSHFGAGSLANAPTYLSEYFVVNPLLFMKELEIIKRNFGIIPIVNIDASALMTIPYDMMINQFLESARGLQRHGSCGVGINETMKRSENPEFRITASMLAYPQMVSNKLRDILEYWVPRRLEELHLELDESQAALLRSGFVVNQYLTAFHDMLDHADYRVVDAGVITHRHSIIFEGSQGLQLDALNTREFPHVTNARTGIHNIRKIMNALDIPAINVTYATRAYATRHGAGPFKQHDPEMKFEDPTNAPNEWQGEMKFGLLDFDLIESAIYADLMDANLDKTSWRVAMTCLDQVEHMQPAFRINGAPVNCKSWISAAMELSERIGAAPGIIRSYGPTRDHIPV